MMTLFTYFLTAVDCIISSKVCLWSLSAVADEFPLGVPVAFSNKVAPTDNSVVVTTVYASALSVRNRNIFGFFGDSLKGFRLSV